MFRTLYIISLLIVTYPVSADINGRIVRVLDGDTVEILGEGNQLKRVRLAGIDAPEKNQPFGQRSRQELSSMVTQRIVTVTGEDEDRYGRLLGTVWLGAKDVNAEQIRKGLAWAYRYHGKPVRSDYATLEDEARRQATVSGQSLDRQNPGAGEASITREVQLATPPDSARCRPQGKLDAR